MKRLTREWVKKAEEDFETARRAGRVRRRPLRDIVCFHAQQCIEKYLKAFLQERSIPFGKTHDLTMLSKVALPVAPGLAGLATELQDLTESAVKYRYPGAWATARDAKRALEGVRKLRRLLRQALALK